MEMLLDEVKKLIKERRKNANGQYGESLLGKIDKMNILSNWQKITYFYIAKLKAEDDKKKKAKKKLANKKEGDSQTKSPVNSPQAVIFYFPLNLTYKHRMHQLLKIWKESVRSLA